MHTYLLYLLVILALTGCVNYAGIRGHSTPLDATALSTQHAYPAHVVHLAKKSESSLWWERFHDAQLNTYIAIALQDSPSMKVAESRLRKAEQTTKEVYANLWPSVDLSGYVERERFSTFGLIPPPFNGRTFNIGDIGLNFNYEFDFWGKNRESLAASVSRACAVQADLAQAKLILASSITHTYLQLQAQFAQLEVAKKILKDRKESLAISQKRTIHGIQSDTPVKTSESDVEAAQITIKKYQRLIQLSKHQIAVLMGKNPLQTSIRATPLQYTAEHVDMPSNLPANLLAIRPDILAARLRTEAAAHKINVAKARFFPDINLIGLFSFQSVGLGHLFNKTSQTNGIGGAIDLPVFDAGARRANLGERYAEYDVAVNQYNETILTALREVADQLATIKSIKSQLHAQNTSVKATRINYKLARSRYNHGIVDYTQVLTAKETLLQEQVTQLDLEARHLQAVVGLMVAMGGNELIRQGRP